MRLIGDVHGRIGDYLSLIRDVPRSIQLGDMGLDYSALPNSPSHVFIMGNHDNYSVVHPCVAHSQGWGIHEGWFLIRGAESTDKALRVEGIDWWADEQLSDRECDLVIDAYTKARPDYVASHDCPQMLLPKLGIDGKGSRTNQLLQALYEIHQPIRWIYGHHHCNHVQYAGGVGDYTIFQCLDELAYIDVPDTEYSNIPKKALIISRYNPYLPQWSILRRRPFPF